MINISMDTVALPLHDYYMLQFAIFLLFKHLICDFILQTEHMAKSKGQYGNWDGIIHSLHHGIGTLLVSVVFVSPKLALILALVDFLIHYHIDWFKMRFGPASYKDKHYWVWFGTDQFLHQLTIVLVLIISLISGETVDFKL